MLLLFRLVGTVDGSHPPGHGHQERLVLWSVFCGDRNSFGGPLTDESDIVAAEARSFRKAIKVTSADIPVMLTALTDLKYRSVN